jgi:hypothetical protein
MWSGGGIRTNLKEAAWGPKGVEFVLWTSTKLTLNIQSLKGNFYDNGFKSKDLPNAQASRRLVVLQSSYWQAFEISVSL